MMGLLQDEILSDALKLAFAAGTLSYMTPCVFPSQMPIVFLAPSTPYDFMNPTTTKPLTTPNPHLRSPYVVIPLYTIIPLPIIQVQVPPPQSTPSPHSPDSTFWDVVGRTIEYSVQGAVALAYLFSQFVETTSQKDLAFLRDDQQPPSCDSFDLDSLPSISAEDDLLRVDFSGLESIPSSELYPGEEDLTTAVPAAPRLFSNKTRRPPPPRSSCSGTTLVTVRESYLPSEDLSMLLRMPDNELYFNPEHLKGSSATPPRHSTNRRSLPLRYR